MYGEEEKAVAADRSAVLTHALAETANRLDLGPTEIGKIVGVSQPTASRLLKGEYPAEGIRKGVGAFSPPCAPISFAFLFGRQRRQFGPRLAAIGEQGLRRSGTHRADQNASTVSSMSVNTWTPTELASGVRCLGRQRLAGRRGAAQGRDDGARPWGTWARRPCSRLFSKRSNQCCPRKSRAPLAAGYPFVTGPCREVRGFVGARIQVSSMVRRQGNRLR